MNAELTSRSRVHPRFTREAPSLTMRGSDYPLACRLFFHAVVPALSIPMEKLSAMRTLLPEKPFSVCLSGPFATGVLCSFNQSGSTCRPWKAGAHADLILHFGDPRTVLNQLRGSSTIPKLQKGWNRPFSLIRFGKIMKRFEAHLKAPERFLEDGELEIRTETLLETAVRSVSLLAACDPASFRFFSGQAPGTILLSDGNSLQRKLRWTGFSLDCITPSKEASAPPAVEIRFRNRETLLAILEEREDPIVQLAMGGVSVRGRIPLADAFSALLDRLGGFTR